MAEDLDDKVVGEFHNLTKKVKSLPEEEYYKQLVGILHEEIDKYFHKKKDKKTHELKWKSEEQLKEFAEGLWDKAADHIAKHYLKMKPGEIKELKGAKDPDDPDKTQWENFIATYLGHDKESFFEELRDFESITPENKSEYVKPLYNQHLGIRTGKHLSKKIKTDDDASKLLKYLKTAKEHNPKAFKGVRLPDKFKTPEKAKEKYMRLASLIPDAYDPKKPDTYQPAK